MRGEIVIRRYVESLNKVARKGGGIVKLPVYSASGEHAHVEALKYAVPLGGLIFERDEVFERVDKDHILRPGRGVSREMDPVAVVAAAYRGGFVGVLLVTRRGDLLVKTEVAGGQDVECALYLSIYEFLRIGVGVEVDEPFMVGIAGARTAVVGTAVADVDVSGLIRDAVEHVGTEFGNGVPGVVRGVCEGIRPVRRLGYPYRQKPATGVSEILLERIRVFVGVESYGVSPDDKGRGVERAAYRKQVVEHAAFLRNVRASARPRQIRFVHIDGPRQSDILINRLIDVTDGLGYRALTDDTGRVVVAGFGAGTVRRVGYLVAVIYREVGGVVYDDLVVLRIVRLVDDFGDELASEKRHVRVSRKGRSVMLVGGRESVTGAGAVTEQNGLALCRYLMRGALGGRSEDAGYDVIGADVDPFVRAELRVEHYRVVFAVGDLLRLEALGLFVEVRVKERVAEGDLVEAVFARDKRTAQRSDRAAVGGRENPDLNLIVGEGDGRVLLAVVCGVSVVPVNGEVPRRHGDAGIPFKVRDRVSVFQIIRFEVEHTDRLGVHDLSVVIVEAVFVEAVHTHGAARHEYGVFKRPASLRGSVGVGVDAVKRMYVTVRLIQKRISLLRIVRRFQMTGEYVVVAAVRIRRCLVVDLAAIQVGHGNVL